MTSNRHWYLYIWKDEHWLFQGKGNLAAMRKEEYRQKNNGIKTRLMAVPMG